MNHNNNMKPYLLLALYLLFSITDFAQDKPCKPKLKANRDKIVSSKFIGYSNEISKSNYYNGIVITRYFDEKHWSQVDSIMIYDEQKRISSLTLPSLDHTISYIDDKGNKFMDSLDLGKHYSHQNNYYGVYQQKGVIWTKNLLENSILYYSIYGNDSLKLTYNNQGILTQKLLFDNNGFEVSKRQYSEEGMLMHFDSADMNLHYSNGILHTSSTYINLDTYGKVRTERDYYDNGVIKTERFFKETSTGEIPYLKWKYYNSTGILEKTEQKSVKVYNSEVGFISEPPMPDKIFTIVEQNPEYAGGMTALNQYIEKSVAGILCTTEKELSGIYKINLKVNEDGSVDFINPEGYNASELKSIMAAMPKWKAGRFNGQRTTTTIVIQINID